MSDSIWCTVKNTVNDRMVDDSLLHRLTPAKMCRSTKQFNKLIKKITHFKNYSQYIELKKEVLAKAYDGASDYDSDVPVDEYSKIHDSGKSQKCSNRSFVIKNKILASRKVLNDEHTNLEGKSKNTKINRKSTGIKSISFITKSSDSSEDESIEDSKNINKNVKELNNITKCDSRLSLPISSPKWQSTPINTKNNIILKKPKSTDYIVTSKHSKIEENSLQDLSEKKRVYKNVRESKKLKDVKTNDKNNRSSENLVQYNISYEKTINSESSSESKEEKKERKVINDEGDVNISNSITENITTDKVSNIRMNNKFANSKTKNVSEGKNIDKEKETGEIPSRKKRPNNSKQGKQKLVEDANDDISIPNSTTKNAIIDKKNNSQISKEFLNTKTVNNISEEKKIVKEQETDEIATEKKSKNSKKSKQKLVGDANADISIQNPTTENVITDKRSNNQKNEKFANTEISDNITGENNIVKGQDIGEMPNLKKRSKKLSESSKKKKQKLIEDESDNINLPNPIAENVITDKGSNNQKNEEFSNIEISDNITGENNIVKGQDIGEMPNLKKRSKKSSESSKKKKQKLVEDESNNIKLPNPIDENVITDKGSNNQKNEEFSNTEISNNISMENKNDINNTNNVEKDQKNVIDNTFVTSECHAIETSTIPEKIGISKINNESKVNDSSPSRNHLKVTGTEIVNKKFKIIKYINEIEDKNCCKSKIDSNTNTSPQRDICLGIEECCEVESYSKNQKLYNAEKNSNREKDNCHINATKNSDLPKLYCQEENSTTANSVEVKVGAEKDSYKAENLDVLKDSDVVRDSYEDKNSNITDVSVSEKISDLTKTDGDKTDSSVERNVSQNIHVRKDTNTDESNLDDLDENINSRTTKRLKRLQRLNLFTRSDSSSDSEEEMNIPLKVKKKKVKVEKEPTKLTQEIVNDEYELKIDALNNDFDVKKLEKKSVIEDTDKSNLSTDKNDSSIKLIIENDENDENENLHYETNNKSSVQEILHTEKKSTELSQEILSSECQVQVNITKKECNVKKDNSKQSKKQCMINGKNVSKKLDLSINESSAFMELITGNDDDNLCLIRKPFAMTDSKSLNKNKSSVASCRKQMLNRLNLCADSDSSESEENDNYTTKLQCAQLVKNHSHDSTQVDNQIDRINNIIQDDLSDSELFLEKKISEVMKVSVDSHTPDLNSKPIQARPCNLETFIEEENLTKTESELIFSSEDIHADDEIFVLHLPASIPVKELTGKKMVLKEKHLKLGKDKYEIHKKNAHSMTCILGANKTNKKCKIENLTTQGSIIVRRKIDKKSAKKKAKDKTNINMHSNEQFSKSDKDSSSVTTPKKSKFQKKSISVKLNHKKISLNPDTKEKKRKTKNL